MTTKTDAQAIAELVWFAEMSATRCHDLGERNEKLRAELEAANAKIAELEQKNKEMRDMAAIAYSAGRDE